MFFTSILITCLMDDSTSGMRSQSIIYSQSEVHSVWDFWSSSIQECKGNVFFQSQVGQFSNFWSSSENLKCFFWRAAPARRGRFKTPPLEHLWIDALLAVSCFVSLYRLCKLQSIQTS